jgi:hypothetical protein
MRCLIDILALNLEMLRNRREAHLDCEWVGLFFFLFLTSVSLFMRAYRRRLVGLEGPWIFREIVQDRTGS